MRKIISGLFIFVAMGLAAAVFVLPDRGILLLALSALFGGLAMIAQLFAGRSGAGETVEQIADLIEAQDGLAVEFEQLRQHMEAGQDRASSGDGAVIGQLAQQVKSLELAVTSLSRVQRASNVDIAGPETYAADQFQLKTEPPAPNPESSPATGDRPARARAAPELNATMDRDFANFDLYLEPVIDLATEKTAHYRASLACRSADGRIMPATDFYVHARRQGRLSKLELQLFDRLAPALERLQAKGRSAGVFCPVSSWSFADDDFIEGLLDFVDRHKAIAGYLIIEVTQRSLGQLSDKGMSGLAHLAQLGALFSLQDAQVRMPEIATLKSLNFGFVDVDANLLTRALLNPGTHGGTLADELRQQQISIIAANVTERRQIEDLGDFASHARGPLYSRPRLVRQQLDHQPHQMNVA